MWPPRADARAHQRRRAGARMRRAVFQGSDSARPCARSSCCCWAGLRSRRRCPSTRSPSAARPGSWRASAGGPRLCCSPTCWRAPGPPAHRPHPRRCAAGMAPRRPARPPVAAPPCPAAADSAAACRRPCAHAGRRHRLHAPVQDMMQAHARRRSSACPQRAAWLRALGDPTPDRPPQAAWPSALYGRMATQANR